MPPIARTNYAAPGYFETVGIPVLEGRTFDRSVLEKIEQELERQFGRSRDRVGTATGAERAILVHCSCDGICEM